jgi:hypothetical protein
METDMAQSNTTKTSVSIVTISQYSRMGCLQILGELIKTQIYTNIIEWVIVEGSPNKMDAFVNEQHFLQLEKDAHFGFPLVYVKYEEGQKLSDLRNAGNAVCKGDIIVCMDDDDYYPPTRVSHAVYKLTTSTALIAGCSKSYIYFYPTKQFYQFRSFGENHSTNNCMAYKRAYLQNHAHAPQMTYAEESSFTNNFSEPMVQLNPSKCIVVSGHSANTVDKRMLYQPKYNSMMLTEITEKDAILDFIPLPVLIKYEKMFIPTQVRVRTTREMQ